VNTNSISYIAFGVELRIAGLPSESRELCACADEAAQEHGNIKKIFPLLRCGLSNRLLKPDH